MRGEEREGRGLKNVVVAGRAFEERFDGLRFALRRRLGRLGPVEVVPYRGYGTPRAVFIKGRVLKNRGVTPSSADDTRRTNLRNMIRRFASVEVPYARVRGSFGGQEVEVVADEEGFFDLFFELVSPPEGDAAWRPVEVELVWPGGGEALAEGQDGVRAVGSALFPARARFGVISDLDDTVIQSGVTKLLTMARTVLLKNAHTRLPFEGVAAFYGALQKGADGDFNPIFYVSSGPWNLYDVLEDFLEVHGLPPGPFFLRDWGPTSLRGHEKHKLGAIRALLAAYPELPFILIGDSGEKDPEIYHRVVREHPGRILAVYIRDVATRGRQGAVRAIARSLRASGVEMLLVPDTTAAAEHAARRGWIPPDALPGIRENARVDAGASG